MGSTIVGLDIGNGMIRAAEVADVNKPRPRLVRYATMPLSDGAAQRGEVVESLTVTATLKQLWSTAGFTTKKVVLGMGNPRVLVRDLSVPRMPVAQIKEALPFQVQDLLPVPIDDAILDFYPVSEATLNGAQVINGLLIAAMKEPVLRNVEAVKSAGLDPVQVDLLPFAVARAVATGPEARGRVGLVHVGAVTSTVIVSNDGAPQFIRIIPIGGHDVTAALVDGLGIEAVQADRIKRGFGLGQTSVSPEWQPAIDIIRRVTGELFDSVRNTISFYLNTHQGEQIDRLLISGGGAMLEGFAAGLADATRLPVGAPDPLVRFSLAKTVDRGQLMSDLSGVSTPVGLAIGAAA